MEITLVLPIAGHKYTATFRRIFRVFRGISKFLFIPWFRAESLRIMYAVITCLGPDIENDVNRSAQDRVPRNLKSSKLKIGIRQKKLIVVWNFNLNNIAINPNSLRYKIMFTFIEANLQFSNTLISCDCSIFVEYYPCLIVFCFSTLTYQKFITFSGKNVLRKMSLAKLNVKPCKVIQWA